MRNWNDDPFTKKARKDSLLARSVYKLEEIDRRERILQGARLIIDLGASPGSWSQYCLKAISAPDLRILAVDLAPIRLTDPRLTFFQAGIEATDFSSALNGKKADVVLSDMAPKTSGIHDRDVALSHELALLALETARKHLRSGGNFVAKLFMGDSFDEYDSELKKTFAQVNKIRPESTRKHSREIFFVAKRYRGESP